MTRIKKSRKPGPLAPRKVERPQDAAAKPAPKSKEKGKGQKAGSRYAVSQQTKSSTAAKNQRDARLGSKKPIALGAAAAKAMTPEQEFRQLENDRKLQDLLVKLEAGYVLNKIDQHYVDEKLDRYQELAAQLGIDLDAFDEDDDNDANEEYESRGEVFSSVDEFDFDFDDEDDKKEV
ncbi:MAG: GTPase-activating protein [Aliidiomarina sp.]|uniref:Der GTPase-activating protein YihI n=1 Tax=Aliidiomarina sp. TaxID=1872439 RepID=UPI0025C2381F|nr:Der GTPase-activating protein YihI [Aliidiomarina sp.]MCH8501011.1 GTPase-activating protein [Aliidiomarina sp.]